MPCGSRPFVGSSSIRSFGLCRIASVNKTLIEGGVSLYTVHRRENKKLEDVFIELTGGKEGGVQIG
jgi:hypothetical protein